MDDPREEVDTEERVCCEAMGVEFNDGLVIAHDEVEANEYDIPLLTAEEEVEFLEYMPSRESFSEIERKLMGIPYFFPVKSRSEILFSIRFGLHPDDVKFDTKPLVTYRDIAKNPEVPECESLVGKMIMDEVRSIRKREGWEEFAKGYDQGNIRLRSGRASIEKFIDEDDIDYVSGWVDYMDKVFSESHYSQHMKPTTQELINFGVEIVAKFNVSPKAVAVEMIDVLRSLDIVSPVRVTKLGNRIENEICKSYRDEDIPSIHSSR